MKLSVSSLYKQFVEFYKKLSKKAKIITFSVLGAIVIGSIIIVAILNKTTYTALYTGLSKEESSQILSYLQTLSVDVQLRDNGTILVPEDQVASLKMQLAAEGYPKSTLNYDLFMNQSDLFTTDYERKKLLIFQLQDRLQDSIKTLEGVKDAIVTLSIPDDNSYVLKNDKDVATASVVLELEKGVTLTSKQIKGIENLVSNSVPGLTAENVSILTTEMEPLNGEAAEKNDNDAALKAETINKINNLFAKSLKDFLKPVFGERGVSVSVNVKVDFDKVSSKETVYTPVVGENGIITWVQRSSSSTVKGDTSNAGGISGTGSNTTPVYEQSEATTSNAGKIENKEEFSANYLVNQLIKEIENSGGNITDMTVAVVVNKKELSDEQKQQYRELVAYGAGIPVDKVALTNAEFFTPEESTTSQPQRGMFIPLSLDINADDLVIPLGVAAIILIIVIFARLIMKALAKSRQKRLLAQQIKLDDIDNIYEDEELEEAAEIKKIAKEKKKKKKKKEEKVAKKAEEQEEVPAEEPLSEDAVEMQNKPKPKKARVIENMPEEIVLTETREQALKRQIKEFSARNPEMVANLLRIWIREDENK